MARIRHGGEARFTDQAMRAPTRAICPDCEYRWPLKSAVVSQLNDPLQDSPAVACPRCRVIRDLRVEPCDERWAEAIQAFGQKPEVEKPVRVARKEAVAVKPEPPEL